METSLKLARFTSLVLAGLLAGNELGTKVAVHPALEELSVLERIRAEKEVTRRYAAVMPFWMSSTLLSCVAVVALSRGPRRGSRGFVPALIGAVCFAGMLLSTLLGNAPINRRVLEWNTASDGEEEFVELRERWDRLHTLRVVLNLVGFASLVIGALRKDTR